MELVGHEAAVYAVALDVAEGRDRVVSGGNDGMIKVWTASTGQCVRTIATAHVGRVWGIQLCRIAGPDQCLAVSCGEDRTARLWCTEEGRCVRTFRGHTGAVFRVATDWREGKVVTAGEDKTVRVWNLSNERQSQVLRVWPILSCTI